jgi:hypothetical protein
MGHVMLAVAGGGAASGTIASGSPKGALSGAVTSLAYFGAGQLATTLEVGLAGRSAIHGVTGGVLDELQGGSFGHGFINAGVNKYLSTSLMTEHLGTDALIAALVGGTMSEATGGDFASGALSSAMQFAMNACIQGLCDSNLEQTLYDWMPGYKFGTWVGNRVFGRDMGTWGEMLEGTADLFSGGRASAGLKASQRATGTLSIVDDAGDTARGVRAGQAGAFGSLRGVKGDGLTPHHMPQAAAKRTGYQEGGALVMKHEEHAATRTYGAKGIGTLQREANLSFRDVLARDIRDVRSIVGPRYNQGLRDLTDYYRRNFPDLMAK